MSRSFTRACTSHLKKTWIVYSSTAGSREETVFLRVLAPESVSEMKSFL